MWIHRTCGFEFTWPKVWMICSTPGSNATSSEMASLNPLAEVIFLPLLSLGCLLFCFVFPWLLYSNSLLITPNVIESNFLCRGVWCAVAWPRPHCCDPGEQGQWKQGRQPWVSMVYSQGAEALWKTRTTEMWKIDKRPQKQAVDKW